MMQPTERNYKIYDKEWLAVVEALTKWRQCLLEVWSLDRLQKSQIFQRTTQTQ